MTKLFDLPNELIRAITFHLTKPSSMLHLALTNKRAHTKIIPLLYENLTFDHRDYDHESENIDAESPGSSIASFDSDAESPGSSVASFDSRLGAPSWNRRHGSPLTSEPPGPEAPFTNIVLLARMLQSSSLPLSQTVTSLTLRFTTENECNFSQTALLILMPHLSSLRHFALEALSENSTPPRSCFSFAPLAGALRHISGVLRSFSMYVESLGSDGWTVGDLRHLVALEVLSIQVEGLLGDEVDKIADADLIRLLPSKLKHLRILCSDLYSMQSVGKALETYVSKLQVPQRLETVTLQMYENAVGRNIELLGTFEADMLRVKEQAMQRGIDIDIKVVVTVDYS